MTDLKGRTVVVIGGSSGIGLRVAELASADGAQLIIGGRGQQRLDEAFSSCKSIGESPGTKAVVFAGQSFSTAPPENPLITYPIHQPPQSFPSQHGTPAPSARF